MKMGITVIIIVLLVLTGLGLSIKTNEKTEVNTGFIPHNIEQVEIYGEELMTNVYTTKAGIEDEGVNPYFLVESANRTDLFKVDHGGTIWFNQQTDSEFLYTDSAGKLLRGSEYWVNETGDTMTGNLVVTDANITISQDSYFCLNVGCTSYIMRNATHTVIT